MKFFDALKYTAICFAVYLALAFLEIFVLRHVLDMLSDDYLIRIAVLLVCLFLVNPLVTYRISEKLPFAPKDLQVASGLEEALRSEVELPED